MKLYSLLILIFIFSIDIQVFEVINKEPLEKCIWNTDIESRVFSYPFYSPRLGWKVIMFRNETHAYFQQGNTIPFGSYGKDVIIKRVNNHYCVR